MAGLYNVYGEPLYTPPLYSTLPYIKKGEEKTKMTNEITVWRCPECGREIASIYPSQLENNKKVHLLTHTNKNKNTGKVKL